MKTVILSLLQNDGSRGSASVLDQIETLGLSKDCLRIGLSQQKVVFGDVLLQQECR